MNRSEITSQFMSMFNTTEEEANFFLEACDYDINIAAESFLQQSTADRGTESSPGNISPPSTRAVTTSTNNPSVASRQGPVSASKQPSSQRVATLHNTKGSSPADDHDSSEEEGQHFFVGGGGQEVLGPPKKRAGGSRDTSERLIRDVFKGARESGAEVMNPSERNVGSSSTSTAFRGTGYRLGESEAVNVPTQDSSSHTAESPRQDYEVVVKLWENGVSWNDEPLKPYEDPQTVSFVSALRQGQIPPEVLREARGRMVDLQMEDHRHEKFVPPPMKPFSGAGHKLGVPAPGTNITPGVVATTSSGPSAASAAPLPTTPVEADAFSPQAPSTQVQIRLADGSRLVARLNHSHTIADIRRLILRYHSASQGRAFVLATTFPNKELTDESQSLVDAKLLGAAVLQRYK